MRAQANGQVWDLDSLEVRESDLARIYQDAGAVFKLRVPIRLRLGDRWLDLTSIEGRRQACLEEERFYRRRDSDVALGVVALLRDEQGRMRFGHAVEHGWETIDWALHMRRLPEAERLDRRLARQRLGEEEIHAVAAGLARLHAQDQDAVEPSPSGPAENEAEPETEAESVLEALRARVRLRIEAPDWPRRSPLPAEVAEIEARLLDLLARQSERFACRTRAQRIPEGHGELGLEHVFLSDSGRVALLAGFEGPERPRDVDRTADVALLAAALASEHRVDLAEAFVAEYARIAQDFDLYPLLDFYEGLGAMRRGKLAWLCADRFAFDAERAAALRARARKHFSFALAAPRRPLLPASVVAFGGQVASGKSTLARWIARRIAAPVLSADATRDHLLKCETETEAALASGDGNRRDAPGSKAALHEARWLKSFAPGFDDRIYDELLRRAGEVLAAGRPVVIDGCLHTRERRQRVRRLAERFDRPFLFVEATMTPEIQLDRLAERARRDDVDLADWKEIADRLRADWEPVEADELPESQQLRLDTALPLERNARTIEDRLPTWPPGLTG